MSASNYQKFKKAVHKKVFPVVQDELLFLIPEWQRLLDVKDAQVAMHSLIVAYLVVQDARMESLSPEHQNILKWAALLHDISKRGKPEFRGCDHTHPFAGGMTLLKIFHRFGFLDKQFSDGIKVDEAQLKKACELIEKSMHAPVPDEYVKKRFEPGEKFCTEVHSHEYLDEIFDTLWDEKCPVLKRGSFCDLVFRLIFFH